MAILTDGSGNPLFFNGITINPVTPIVTDVIRVTLALNTLKDKVRVTVIDAPEGTENYHISAWGTVLTVPCVRGTDQLLEINVSRFVKDAELTSTLYSTCAIGGAFKEWYLFDLTGAVVPPAPDPIVIIASPQLTAPIYQVGQLLTLTPVQFTGPAISVSTIFQMRTGSSGDPTEIAQPSVIGSELIGKQVRGVTTIVQELNGTSVVIDTGYTPTIEDVAPELPFRLTEDHYDINQYGFYRGASTTHFAPRITFHGLAGETVYDIQWSTTPTDTGSPPDNQCEIFLEADGDTPNYATVNFTTQAFEPYMTEPANRDPDAVPKVDYAVFDATETARRGWFRVRWRKGPALPWSPMSDYIVVPLPEPLPEPEEPPIPTPSADALWRPFPLRPQMYSGAAQVDFPEYYTRGKYWGEGLQVVFSAWNDISDPDCIYLGGDMHGLRRSFDFGSTWHHVPGVGLAGYAIHGVWVDPADRNVVYCLAWQSWGAPGFYGGMFKSTDRAATFTRVQVWDNGLVQNPGDPNQPSGRPICGYPVTGGSAATRRLRAATWTDSTFGPAQGAPPAKPATLWKSTGGDTWTTSTPSWMSGKQVFKLIQLPSNADTWFACTNSGLWKTTNDGTNATEILSGRITDLWIDPTNENRMIANRFVYSGSTGGVHYSINGGSNWTHVLNRTGITTCAVGPLYNTNKRMIVCTPRLSADVGTGLGWRQVINQEWTVTGAPATTLNNTTTPTTGWWFSVLNRPDASDTSGHLSIISSGGQQTFLPHPTNQNLWVTDGFAIPWRSTDNSRSWGYGASGYFGINVAGVGFDSANPRHIFRGVSDIIADESSYNATLGQYTVDYGLKSGPSGSVLTSMQAVVNDGAMTMKCCTVLPNGRVIGAFTDPNSGGVIMWRNPGAGLNDWQSPVGQSAAAGWTKQVRARVDYSRQNNAWVYCGINRSSNGGTAWTSIGSNYQFCNVNYQNGNEIYATDWRFIYKSTDNGATFSTWYDSGAANRLRTTDYQPLIWASLHDFTRVLTAASDGDLQLVKGNPGSQTVIDLGLKTGKPVYWSLARAAWDPTDARRFYVTCTDPGGGTVYRGYFNAGFTALDSMVDISMNFPSSIQGPGLYVNALGEVLAGVGAGHWVLPPPGGAPSTGIWVQLPKPFYNGRTYTPV